MPVSNVNGIEPPEGRGGGVAGGGLKDDLEPDCLGW